MIADLRREADSHDEKLASLQKTLAECVASAAGQATELSSAHDALGDAESKASDSHLDLNRVPLCFVWG